MPPNTVKVDRTTRWGNPYRVGDVVDLVTCRRWGWAISPDGKRLICTSAQEAVRRFAYSLGFDEAIHQFVRQQLAGKNLACWCELPAPGEPDYCHAAVLLELANAPDGSAATKTAADQAPGMNPISTEEKT